MTVAKYNTSGCSCNSPLTDLLEKAGRQLLQYRNFLKLSMGSSEILEPSDHFAASASSRRGSSTSEQAPSTHNQENRIDVTEDNYPADTIYFNGPILTMVADEDRVEALAVKAGKIIAAGSYSEVRKLQGFNTGMVDLEGKCLMPGFIDPHSHVAFQSNKFKLANIDPAPIGWVKTLADLKKALRDEIISKKLAPGSLVMSWGYDDTYLFRQDGDSDPMGHPTRYDLDDLEWTDEDKHPNPDEANNYQILLVHISCHLCTCNSSMLAKAGITAETSFTAGGKIQHYTEDTTPNTEEYPVGSPNGVLEENAMTLLLPYLPSIPPSQAMKILEDGLLEYAKHGITTAQDGRLSPGTRTLLEEMDKLGKLSIDVVGYLDYLFVDEATFNQVPTVYTNNSNPKKRFRIGGMKISADGSIQGYTAFLKEPYYVQPSTDDPSKVVQDKCSDQKTEKMFLNTKSEVNTRMDLPITTLPGEIEDDSHYGYATMTQEEVTKWVRDCDARNVQLLVHTNGDKAIDMLIEAVQAVRKVKDERLDNIDPHPRKFHPLRDLRTVIIHAQTIREDQLDEAKTYGLVPSFFPIHIPFWGERHQNIFLGPDRAARISPAQSALKREMKFTLHHDAPVAGISMLAVAAAAVHRTMYGKDGQPIADDDSAVLGKDQKITPFQALRAITADAAWQNFEEDHKGTLEVGKRADLVILEKDPLVEGRDNPLGMKDIPVYGTIKDGQTIFSLPNP